MKFKAAIIVTGLSSILLLNNCKKEKTGNNPPVQGSIGLKVKILEYGSEIPLANVKFTARKCLEAGKFSCITYGDLKSWTSGTDGNIIIGTYDYPTSIDILTVEEANHWTKSGDYIFDTVIQELNYDYAIIRLYPFASIKVHFKNVNSYGAKEWLRAYMEAWPDNKASFSIEPEILNVQLTKNIDTMFTYKTYGNVENRLVCELLDSNYFFIRKLFVETKFIPKLSSQEWIINY